MYAQVIVDVIHSNVSRPFSYSIPDGMKVENGTRVNVPLGRREVSGFVIGISSVSPEGVPLQNIKPIHKVLDDYPALLPPLLSLANEITENSHCFLSEALRLMLPAAMRTGSIHEKKEPFVRLTDVNRFQEALSAQKRAPKRAALLQLLIDGKEHALSEFSAILSNPSETARSLEKEGWIILENKSVFRSPDGVEKITPTTPPPLTDSQKDALQLLHPALLQGKGSFLLHGVTGSGKTEVYLSLVRKTLEMGKSAIILVPEIALTPQMVRWFCSRFGPETAVLHSRLTDGQRYDEWRRIRLGHAKVVVGARSAVFAPTENLGLIVIDEEHEQTYLSDKHPRYDAREIAQSRCQREGAVLLLSSATPSVLSFAKAKRGDYTLIEMPHRVLNRPMPKVTVVDMRAELESGNRSIFSRALIEKLASCLKKGEQAMLFINRRGYHSFVSCRSCGYVVKCEHCDLTMTLHRDEGEEGPQMLRCHMCGAMKPVPEICPECGSKYIRYFGSGTQRVEEELHKLFPQVKSVRMDIDTTKERDSHAKLLNLFGSGEAQVLIGTQMIAKGLDFPKVTLVGVVAADMTLNLPDYKSPERTFQLITQVAGRAGRAESPGEVVVQTYKPNHPCIEAAAAQDYRSFFEMEFSRRRAGLYPPFTLIARLLVESEQEADAKAMAEQLFNTVQTYLLSHPVQKKKTLLIREDEAPVKRIRGLYRYHVLMKLFDTKETQPILSLIAELSSITSEACHIYFEINPVTLM